MVDKYCLHQSCKFVVGAHNYLFCKNSIIYLQNDVSNCVTKWYYYPMTQIQRWTGKNRWIFYFYYCRSYHHPIKYWFVVFIIPPRRARGKENQCGALYIIKPTEDLYTPIGVIRYATYGGDDIHAKAWWYTKPVGLDKKRTETNGFSSFLGFPPKSEPVKNDDFQIV